MKVKELITKLLDMNMDAEVNISIDEPHEESGYGYSSGYLFNIDYVRRYSPKIVELVFTDWRKSVETKSEAENER
jgi:hypothetical protein